MKILIDTREKKTFMHFQLIKKLEKLGFEVEIKKIDAGDFSFEINGIDYSLKIAIERKSGNRLKGGGFEELKSNLFEFKKSTSADRRTGYGLRISDEFDRLCENKTEVHLLIENAKNSDDLQNCSVHIGKKRVYRSNGEFKCRLTDFLNGINRKRKLYGLSPVKVHYCMSENTPDKIIQIFNEYLKNGNNT